MGLSVSDEADGQRDRFTFIRARVALTNRRHHLDFGRFCNFRMLGQFGCWCDRAVL
jgi:hypothetical protein